MENEEQRAIGRNPLTFDTSPSTEVDAYPVSSDPNARLMVNRTSYEMKIIYVIHVSGADGDTPPKKRERLENRWEEILDPHLPQVSIDDHQVPRSGKIRRSHRSSVRW